MWGLMRRVLATASRAYPGSSRRRKEALAFSVDAIYGGAMRFPVRRAFGRSLALAVLAVALVPTAPATAGRLVATGHDADLHCAGGGPQCGFVRSAVDYVRSGAPDPAKPVLVLDRAALQMESALDGAYGPGAVPRQVVDPRSAEFQALALSTSTYSAILVASDASCGGCDLNVFDEMLGATADSDAINRRKDDITAFFNAGGGLYANSGADHGDGDPLTGPDSYYGFLPLPIGGQQVASPFCLTAAGRAIGLQDPVDGPSGCPDVSQRTGTRDDINCCATHNSFQEPPAGSAIIVAERDANNAPTTLIGDGVAGGGTIKKPGPLTLADLPKPTLGKNVNVQKVSGTVLIGVRNAAAGGGARSSQKGIKFVPLTRARQIPVGAFLNTRKGKVRLQSARNLGGARQNGVFSRGLFQVLQSRQRKAKGLTEVALKGSSFKSCKTAKRGKKRGRRSRVEAVGSAGRTIRRLSGNANGRFRTRGRRSAATVRGTVWDVTDRCDGTLTKVKRGKVAVRDFRLKKTIVLRSGKSYLAR